VVDIRFDHLDIRPPSNLLLVSVFHLAAGKSSIVARDIVVFYLSKDSSVKKRWPLKK
jgi:hypothetical protein